MNLEILSLKDDAMMHSGPMHPPAHQLCLAHLLSARTTIPVMLVVLTGDVYRRR